MEFVSPMLLDERPFALGTPGWLYEIKFDGYRLLANFGHGVCRLRTRNGADATAWFPEITRSLAMVKSTGCIVDGEVCVLDQMGRSVFDRLHDRAKRRRWVEGGDVVTYCIFDLLFYNGNSLLDAPLSERKARLKRLSKGFGDHLLFVSHFDAADAQTVFDSAVIPLALEGLVAKRVESPYTPGVRSPDWIKIKRKGAIPPERFKRAKTKSL